MKLDRANKQKIKCPKDYRRDYKAEVINALGLSASAVLFALMLAAAFIINGL